jgi:hypothetical protein
MRLADSLFQPIGRTSAPIKKEERKRLQLPLLFLFSIIALLLVMTTVGPGSAEVKIALASPHDIDNMRLVAGQGGNFKLRVYNRPESENSLRFEITATGGIAPSLSFSDNGFVLAPDTSEQVTVTISPIMQENVYEGEISIYARSLGKNEGASPVVASVGTTVRVTVVEMPAPTRPPTSIIIIAIVACAVVVSIVWLVRRRSMQESTKSK